MTPGKETSEYKTAKDTSLTGKIFAVVGVLIGTLGGIGEAKGFLALSIVGAVLVIVGGALIGAAAYSYSRSRATVKTAVLMPKDRRL